MREQQATNYHPTHLRTHAPKSGQRPEPKTDEYEDERPRLHTVVKRYNPPQPMRVMLHDGRKQRPTQQQAPCPQPQPKKQRHPLYYLVIGIAIPVCLWLVVSVGASWWSSYQEHQQYGMPRTYQVDARVGHGDETTPSHFIAVNLNRRISVTEFPGGQADKAVVYIGPALLGEGQEKTIVTLDFPDVNNDALPDMVILFNKTSHVLLNTGKDFREVKPGEQINVGEGGK